MQRPLVRRRVRRRHDLEYVTRIGSPDQETCLDGGAFVLTGSNDNAELTLSKCAYGGVELDAVAPLLVTFTSVDAPQGVAEDQSTVRGSAALTSNDSDITECEIAMTITRTNRYVDGTLATAQLSWTGTLCGDSVNVTRAPY
ncbi:MAG TPA: hypothetical protein VGG74_14950 [Kofleriaceae bacterium]|jgi:hypothetical protein